MTHAHEKQGGRTRVIVAEDDAALRRIVAETLRRDGHEVDELRDGKELMDYIEAMLGPGESGDVHSVLITDVHMPKYSGVDALALLRTSNRITPAVLMTGAPDEWVRLKARELGASALLRKPLDLDELRSLVISLLASPAGDRATEQGGGSRS